MDDDEVIMELVTSTLVRAGYRVHTCDNGNEAVELYKASMDAGTPYAVSIMDLTIPGGMGGVETARRILAIDPAAVLVVSSGYSDDPVMANYEKYGFRAAIEKPYRIEDVAEVVRVCAGKRT
jgi:CheY-like chemotaxis protein